jgi:hypothetical protein
MARGRIPVASGCCALRFDRDPASKADRALPCLEMKVDTSGSHRRMRRDRGEPLRAIQAQSLLHIYLGQFGDPQRLSTEAGNRERIIRFDPSTFP